MASEVATAFVSLLPSARGFGRNTARALDGEMGSVGKSQGKAVGNNMSSGILASVKGLAGPMAAVLGGAAVVGFLGGATSAASDLGETMSKTGQIFGQDALPALQKFAQGAATTMGQTQQQALDAAATFGIFGKSAGLTGADLSTFSTGLTTLASDMASFGNADISETIDAIGSGLRGEAEPLRRFGVLLSADAINARALSMGLTKAKVDTVAVAAAQLKVKDASAKSQAAIKKYGEDSDEAKRAQIGLAQAQKSMQKAMGGVNPKLTQQQKLLAVQAEIMAQTSDQQGDFGRTSQGLANQQRILAAQFENAKISVGNVFLPALTSVFRMANNNLFPALGKVQAAVAKAFQSQVVQNFIGDIKGVADQVRQAFKSDAVQGFISDVKGAASSIIANFSNVGDTLQSSGLTSAFNQIVAYARGTLVPALISIGSTVIRVFTSPQVQQFGKTLITIFGQVGRFIVGTMVPIMIRIGQIVVTNVVPAFTTIANFVQTRLLPALSSFGSFLSTEIIPRITSMAQTVADNILPAIRSLAEWLSQKAVPALAKLGGSILDAVDSSKPFITFLAKWISMTAGLVSKLVGFLVPIIVKFAGPVLTALVGAIGKAIEWLGKILGWVGKFGGAMMDAREKVLNFAKGVKDKIGDVIGWFVSLPGKILKGIGGLSKTLWQKGVDLIQGLLDGAGSILPKIGKFFLDKVPGWIKGPFKAALGISSPSKVFAGFGENIGQGLIKGMSAQVGAVRAATGEITDAATPTLADFKAAQARKLARQARGTRVAVSGTAHGLATAATVEIHNHYPKPERASDSTAMTLRRAQYALGAIGGKGNVSG